MEGTWIPVVGPSLELLQRQLSKDRMPTGFIPYVQKSKVQVQRCPRAFGSFGTRPVGPRAAGQEGRKSAKGRRARTEQGSLDNRRRPRGPGKAVALGPKPSSFQGPGYKVTGHGLRGRRVYELRARAEPGSKNLCPYGSIEQQLFFTERLFQPVRGEARSYVQYMRTL